MNLMNIKLKADFHYLKRQIKNNMNKTNIAIVIYVLGLLFGAFVLDIWSAETSPKALLGILWTALFAVSLYYLEFKDK